MVKLNASGMQTCVDSRENFPMHELLELASACSPMGRIYYQGQFPEGNGWETCEVVSR
jgi:hypothetical protein